MLSPPEKKLARQVAELVHKDDLRSAAGLVLDFCGIRNGIDSDSPAQCYPPLQVYLHQLLDHGGAAEAAQLLWTPTQFCPDPQCSQDVWKLFETASFGLLMGGASMSKSFTMGVRLFLEWVRDPEYTSVKVLGPSEDHLEQNLFSHIVGLHQRAKLPMPGEVGELYIGIDRRDQLSAIRGIVIPAGRVKKAGRLQGSKRKPRPAPHPEFGPLSRMFIFIDEIENVPAGIWSDISNVMSNVGSKSLGGLKIFGAFNPTNQQDEVGKRAEPEFGWENFDEDVHYRWKSKRGWNVLRLDGEKSENVITGKEIYPGLQTREGLDQIALDSGGKNTPGYMSMGRGAYPTQSVELTVVPPGMFLRARGRFIWYDDPISVGSCDLALEGGAAALFSLGKFGLATGITYPASLDYPTGQTVMFKTAKGIIAPRHALQLEQQFAIPKGDTIAMSDALIKLCRKAGIRPDYFCCDRTGHGQGVADLMKHNWGSIWAVNYSESPTDAKAMVEDTKKCNEAYSRLCCELYLVMRKWVEFCYVAINPEMDISKLSQQVTQRRFRSLNGKDKVESKKDYKLRGFPSPDESDSFTLLIHAARKGSGIVPSMTGLPDVPDNDVGDGFEGSMYPGGVRIDPSNRVDHLEGGDGEGEDRARDAWRSIQQMV